MTMRCALPALVFLVPFAIAADLKDIDPDLFPKDAAGQRSMAGMMAADANRRMREAGARESKAFGGLVTKEQWLAYRDTRLARLKESLGYWPEQPVGMKVKVTRVLPGDGFVIKCLVYETRPHFWACANLYLPEKPPGKMPGIVIAHSHHGGKSGGELQDMGMTWARAGTAVLVPDQVGYGERREHGFNGQHDYPGNFRAGRQDYYYRYNSNLQLSLIGDSLMGWMTWDLMRGVDILLAQERIDPDRIIMIGSVAGGGDPVGVAAALDRRVACAVPFNFGGWQPESRPLDDPEHDFAWFGDGYWESTRGLRHGARDGFSHFLIVGGIAPRKLVYGHEFAWDQAMDPAWPRIRKIFGFLGATDSLAVAHGKGGVRGPGGPENTHCNHVGQVHRKMIYPALSAWFGMPVPVEYSKPLAASELDCWTEATRGEWKPGKLREVISEMRVARRRLLSAGAEKPASPDERTSILGSIDPVADPRVINKASESVPEATVRRFIMETDQGIVVPLLLLTPRESKRPAPLVLMVAQGGKAGFLKQRSEVIAAFLKGGIAVCLPDVRGTGETSPGSSADRGSARTSVSQANLMLGQAVLGSQLRDLRTVLRWLGREALVDVNRVAVWGDSFAPVNDPSSRFAVPLDAASPLAISEPNGGALAALLGSLEPVRVVIARGSLRHDAMLDSPYVRYPHEAVVPGMAIRESWYPSGPRFHYRDSVDGLNRRVAGEAVTPIMDADRVVGELLR